MSWQSGPGERSTPAQGATDWRVPEECIYAKWRGEFTYWRTGYFSAGKRGCQGRARVGGQGGFLSPLEVIRGSEHWVWHPPAGQFAVRKAGRAGIGNVVGLRA